MGALGFATIKAEPLAISACVTTGPGMFMLSGSGSWVDKASSLVTVWFTLGFNTGTGVKAFSHGAEA